MKTPALLLISFLLLPFITLSQNAQKQKSTKKYLKQLNQTIFEEHVLRHSTDSLKAYAQEDYFLVNPAGKLQSKKQVIAEVNTLDVSKLNVGIDEAILHDHLAILIGTLTLKGTFHGKPLPKKIRYVSVFVLVDNQWRLQSRSLTPIRTGK